MDTVGLVEADILAWRIRQVRNTAYHVGYVSMSPRGVRTAKLYFLCLQGLHMSYESDAYSDQNPTIA